MNDKRALLDTERGAKRQLDGVAAQATINGLSAGAHVRFRQGPKGLNSRKEHGYLGINDELQGA